MPDSTFDIYQTESGYVAVTNEVRRTILAALAKKDRQLPELMKITKKSKPTLSSVHMHELLASNLIEELPHPTDKRKKVYRLKGRRIGSSTLPVEQLRNAVRSYVNHASPARLPLFAALDAICAAPASASEATLVAQARRLGELAAEQFVASTPREAVTALGTLLEREGIARPLRIDLEGLTMEMELERELPGGEARAARLAIALADGLVGARLGSGARVLARGASARRFTLALEG